MSKFEPSQLPNLAGQVAIVTGGHSGLFVLLPILQNMLTKSSGPGTTTELLRHGATVYIASRSRDKGEAAIKLLKLEQPTADVHLLICDLGDLESVKSAAAEFIQQEHRLHILVNNAGVMCTPYSETKQGFETQFQTNYLSHYLLTRQLLPILMSTAETSPKGMVRIVNVSSDGHAKLAPKEGILFVDKCRAKDVSTWTRYGMSKLANILHTKELARRYGASGVIAVCLHPGTVKTNLSQGPRNSTPLYRLIQPLVELGAPGPERGAWPLLWCAASSTLTVEDNGSYFLPIGKKTPASKSGEDKVLAGRLWDWTEKELANAGV
ncbi:hypothetical protein OIDMADRAFT_29274 [Oidiodendron maius Zn]|uniref:NAD(P)-binding protein n=1 Tax=Oidiodendron maius (strain Zn) TaxID=913774 RepID=A0A0C3GVP3_OIDMZ|nr:hypothetical protein OIDMADRAFT_29274 [Oidiodendron maius Zn]